MIADQAYSIFVVNMTRSDRDKAVIVAVAEFDALPKLISIYSIFVKAIFLGKPACERVQVS